MNFDNLLIHCSSLGLIMTDPKEKSNKEKYYEANEKFKVLKSKYDKLKIELDNIKNKETIAYKKSEQTLENYFIKLSNLNELINELEPIRNIIPLSDTCKSHLMDLFVETRYGR